MANKFNFETIYAQVYAKDWQNYRNDCKKNNQRPSLKDFVETQSFSKQDYADRQERVSKICELLKQPNAVKEVFSIIEDKEFSKFFKGYSKKDNEHDLATLKENAIEEFVLSQVSKPDFIDKFNFAVNAVEAKIKPRLNEKEEDYKLRVNNIFELKKMTKEEKDVYINLNKSSFEKFKKESKKISKNAKEDSIKNAFFESEVEKSNFKDLAVTAKNISQSNSSDKEASPEHNLFVDLNQNDYEKYYQNCLKAKQSPSKADFYDTYDLIYSNGKQRKDYASTIYEVASHIPGTPISRIQPEITALALFANDEFNHYVLSHKFILPKKNAFAEAEQMTEFYVNQKQQLEQLKDAKSAKDLQAKRNLEEKLELSKNFARYISDDNGRTDIETYANAFKARYEKFKANHPIEWLPEDLQSNNLIVEGYLKSAFYTEDFLNGTMLQTQRYADRIKNADKNGIAAYADFYNSQYQEFLNSLSRDENGNLLVDEIQAKTTFYMRNGGNLSVSPIDGVEYFKDGDEHNLMFGIDAENSRKFINIVVKDGKSNLRLSDGTLAELNNERPFVENEGKFIAQTNISNVELPVNETNCKYLNILKNYPAQIPANIFVQVEKKKYKENISNIADITVSSKSNEEKEIGALLYKAGDVNYYYFPYKTESNEDSYFRVMQKNGKTYINLENPKNKVTETYEIENIDDVDKKLCLNVQKDGYKKVGLPIEIDPKNAQSITNLFLLIKNKQFNSKEISLEQCPNVSNLVLNELTTDIAPELQNTKLSQSRSRQAKEGQILTSETFTSFDKETLNGYGQNISFAISKNIENQKLSMLDAKNSNLLFNVSDKNKTVAEFVEENGKVILKLDKETVNKFISQNNNVKLELKENEKYFSCEIEKLMFDEKGDISIKAANTNNAYSLSAFGVQIADKHGSRGILKSDSILNIGTTNKGYESILTGKYGCSMNPKANNLNNALSIAYTVLERQNKTDEQLHSSSPLNLSNIPNLEIYSIPIKLNDGNEQFLNVKKENGKTYVYMHITSEKNEIQKNVPQWYEVKNASFNETNPTKDTVDDPALHFDLIASNNTTANVRIPLNSYTDNANAVAVIDNVFSTELSKPVNGREGKPAQTFPRELKTTDGKNISIKAYRRAEDTNAANLIDLDKVGVLSRVKDKSAATQPTEGLVAGHPVEEISDPVTPTAATASPSATDEPAPTSEETTAENQKPAETAAPATETNAAPTTSAAQAPAKEEKKKSEWKKIGKSALLPIGLALSISGMLFPPFFLVGATMLGIHALNQLTPNWISKLFHRETPEGKAEKLQKENELYLNLSKADLDKNNARIASLKAERDKIYNDTTLSAAKKQKKLAKLDSQIRNLNEENIAINNTRSYVQSKNTNALLETERQKNINDQKISKNRLKATAKADKANARPLEKQQKQTLKEYEQTRNGMIKLAKELDSLTKLSKSRELTKKEETRRQKVYNQLINNGEIKQTYQDKKQNVADANANVQAQKDLAQQHQNEIKGQIHAAEEAQKATEKRIEEQNIKTYQREIEAAEASRQELNEDLKPYTPEWARTESHTAATTTPEHGTGVTQVNPVTPTADSSRNAAREH